MRRVLFLHPRKPTPEALIPHLGLGSLCAQLLRAGHAVTVLEEVLYEPDQVPDLAQVLADTQPDVVGVSVYTSTLDRAFAQMREVRAHCAAPILVGGPHATLFPEQIAASGLADYVVRGEAEGVIAGLVERAERREKAEVVDCAPVEVGELPWPDYTPFLNAAAIKTYPLMTSRGCPYNCSFCAVKHISSRTWRPRDPLDCAQEVAAARRTWPGLEELKISDDCPTCRLDHFKTFLRHLAKQQPVLPLVVDNTRADRIDGELLDLLREAGASRVCLGVESGDPEVFALVNKGETLEDIRRAARLVKEHGLELALCFVIGLPGDNLQRTRASIRLAQELEPSSIFWNMAHPFPATEMYAWFEQYGDLDPPRRYTSYDFHTVRAAEPAVSTPEFSKWDRRRAYFLAVVETDQYLLTRAALPELLSLGWRFRMLGPALRSLFRRGLRALWRRVVG